ncbi:G patch domain-containing protein 1 [Bombina bombina]|uniref:G patch domain-containing protein 1 n=1 Tax=Bombina bombina TaxID=8345 RepID=UPI00235A902E|nr:G patch domain-containing protein 1 [Bombina bombina]
MAANDSDEDEDFVTFGKPLEPYEEGEQPKKPIPLQDQTVKDEKGRYKRFHGAFMGGFSAGYFNTVGSKEGWAPSTFVSSRQGRSEKYVSRPEDFMDEEDLGEFGIAPNEIMTTDDFASKTKDSIKEKARELASVTTPIPGATILEDLIAPAKITIGVQLLRQMGWKEGQGVGPRTKRKARKQKPESGVKLYGCALPRAGSEESEEDDDDEYLPENVTFAPKDVIPIDFAVKDNVHGLGYRGLDPRQALFGSFDSRVNLFTDGSERTSNLLGDLRHSKGRKVGISGQAFGVGALEDEDDDIYGTVSLSKYDTVVREEESGDGLFGWTAPKEYKNNKEHVKSLQYTAKILDGFCKTAESTPPKKIYSPPELPRDYRPVHHFRPVLTPAIQNSPALQALLTISQTASSKPTDESQKQSRHHLNSSKRRELLGETPLQGPSSVLELLSEKDRERIKDVKQAVEQQKLKAQSLAQECLKSRFQSSSPEQAPSKFLGEQLSISLQPGDFRPFEKNPEKQQRYESYIRNLQKGEKDALESSIDVKMTEWERGREQEEFMKSAMLYKSSNSMLSSRFTRAKYEDDLDKVDVPRDEEGDVNDKAAAVKMKMFGKLTRDTFEWHPDNLLCKRFNIPDPYPESTLVGLPKVKRDKFSVFNFLTVPETPKSSAASTCKETLVPPTENKSKKPSRWDISAGDKKDSVGEFETDVKKQEPEPSAPSSENITKLALGTQSTTGAAKPNDTTLEEEEEEKRPPIDIFKAIFADSSDEKSSSSEEESDEDEPSNSPEEAKHYNPDAISSTVQEPATPANEPAPFTLPEVRDTQKQMGIEEEFGPKLPPALPSTSTGISNAEPLLNAEESFKKQKQKKHKEKHKMKKERKHKKDKKKKHKKEKHKSKHKNKKTENKSSDSEDSNTSESDSGLTVELTPKELLKRLKNFPIPR